ncbi:HalOD1 output domain-containing protein [Halobacteriales archaeon Cl-PHB]
MTGERTDGGVDQPPRTRLTHEIAADERPSEAVVRAVAALRNENVLDLEPLYSVVDPEYVDGICESTADDRTELTFAYSGCLVSVTPVTVTVTVAEESPRS